MLNIWIIAIFMVVILRDSLGEAIPTLGSGAEATTGGDDWWVWVLGLLPYAAIAGLVQVVMVAAGREMDRRGSLRAIAIADRTVVATRPIVVIVHAGNVFLLGWLSSSRAILGDVVLLDELVCVVPPLLVFVCAWWSAYPVERRMREGTLWRMVETGRPVYPIPSRGQYVLSNVRNQLTLSIVPILVLAAWSEVVDRGLHHVSDYLASAAVADGGGLRGSSGLRSWVMSLAADEAVWAFSHPALQIAGVVVVIGLSPLMVRGLWDTVRLGAGPLRDRLVAMCRRNNVRVREILVWRTHGMMINGAVVGMFPRLRYVLLTDALLDSMSQRQVEAVMAHEIGHARCGHMPWLAAVLLVSIGCAGAGGSLVVQWTIAAVGIDGAAMLAQRTASAASQAEGAEVMASLMQLGGEIAVSVGALVVGILSFGLVSRRFEWQADAFAAKALTAMPQSESSLKIDSSQIEDAVVPGYSGHGAPSLVLQENELDQKLNLIACDAAAEVLADVVAVRDLPTGPIVHRGAVDAMAGALQTVAQLNHIPRHRGSFRHGSIAQRQSKLRELVGVPLDRLPIDRTVRWIKRAAIGGILLLLTLAILDY